MRFRNSIKLLTENFKHIYPMLLLRIVIGVIGSSLIALVVVNGLNFFMQSTPMQTFIEATKNVLYSLFGHSDFASFDSAFKQAIDMAVESFASVLQFIGDNMGGVILSVLLVLLVYVVSRFLNGMVLFAFGTVINDKMSMNSDTPFFLGYFRNIGSSALYQVVYVPVAFAYDLLSVMLSYFLAFVAFGFAPVLFEAFLFMGAILVLQALKLTVVSDWMPSIVYGGKGIRSGFVESVRFSRRRFGGYFSTYFVTVYLIVVVNVIAAVCTFGSALLLSIPASYAVLIIEQFVNYYTRREEKYFVSNRLFSEEVHIEESKY